MVKQNNNVLLIALVLIGGLVAGLIGGAIGSSITGDVTLSNNAAGTGTYRIRPEGTYADTWLPYKDGSIYLTSNGQKGGGIVFRKWNSGTSFTKLATIGYDGIIGTNQLRIFDFSSNLTNGWGLRTIGSAFAITDNQQLTDRLYIGSNGKVTITSLKSNSNSTVRIDAYACIDPDGTLYRSSTACN